MEKRFSRSNSVKLRRPETKSTKGLERPYTLANSKILWHGCGTRHGKHFPTNCLPKISELQVVLILIKNIWF